MITIAFVIALGTVLGLMLTILRVIGKARTLKNLNKIDLGITVFAFIAFAGTSTLGIVAAMFTGFLAATISTIVKMWYKRFGKSDALTDNAETDDQVRDLSLQAELASVHAKHGVRKLMKGIRESAVHR